MDITVFIMNIMVIENIMDIIDGASLPLLPPTPCFINSVLAPHLAMFFNLKGTPAPPQMDVKFLEYIDEKKN
jgi:hypothetical protein